MSLEQILERLCDVRRNRDGWIARCPAHDDRSPSLSITERNEKILLHCFAGCTVRTICGALRIRLADLFTGSGAVRRVESPIVRAARQASVEGLSCLSRSVRSEPVTVIFADYESIDAAIARALALTVEGELCQVALKGDAR